MAKDYLLNIMQHVRQSGQLTRREIAQRMGLSFSLVSRLSNELIRRGLITPINRSESDGGRPADLLVINPTAGYVIGLEVNSAIQKAAVVNLQGEVVFSLVDEALFPGNRDKAVEYLHDFVQRLISLSQLPPDKILGMGIGLWALVDSISGTVGYWTETPRMLESTTWTASWNDYPLRSMLEQRFSWPYIVVDDIVRMLGLAEVRYNEAIDRDEDFIFALADTGIGAAIMIGNTPYIGASHFSGELGHVPINGGTIRCACGNVGCLETLASSNAIMDRVRQRLRGAVFETALFQAGDALNIQDVIQAAELGDKLAYQVLTEAGEYFGKGLATMINLIGLRLVVVGGVLATSNTFLDAIRRTIKLQALNKITNGLHVERNRMDEFAGVRGAASRVIEELFQPEKKNILTILS